MRKWFLVLSIALGVSLVGNSEQSGALQDSGTIPASSPTETTEPGVSESPTFVPPSTVFDSDSGGEIEVANLSEQEVSFLGKAIREVISRKRVEETDVRHKILFSSLDEVVMRLEGASEDDIRHIIRQEDESEEILGGVARDLTKSLHIWAATAVAAALLSPPVLITIMVAYPTAVLVSEPLKMLAERLTMGSVGSLTLRSSSISETIILSVIHDKKAGEAIITVDFYPVVLTGYGTQVTNNPSETIFMMIPFKRIVWDENAGTTTAVFPEYGGDEVDWESERVWVHFKSALTQVSDVTLTLYVHENSSSGPVVSGVIVAGQDEASDTFSYTTNSDGYVSITGAPGTWSFTASKSGYDNNSWEQSITTTDINHAYLTKQVSLDCHDYVAQGDTFLGMWQLEHAIAEYTGAIELYPDCAVAYSHRGKAYTHEAFFRHSLIGLERAIEDLDKAIDIEPAYALAYARRGYAYGIMGEYEQGMDDCNRAIQIEPGLAAAYNDRGTVYAGQELYDLAITDFNRAIELDYGYVGAYYNRAGIYFKQGEYDLATADCNRAIEIDPEFAPAYAGRGNTYGKQGEYDLAIADFSTAIQLYPKYASAYYRRGLAYSKQGKKNEAMTDLEEAILLSDDPEFINKARELMERIEEQGT
jgi:tetratricopeptide (TPR) repeat protein